MTTSYGGNPFLTSDEEDRLLKGLPIFSKQGSSYGSKSRRPRGVFYGGVIVTTGVAAVLCLVYLLSSAPDASPLQLSGRSSSSGDSSDTSQLLTTNAALGMDVSNEAYGSGINDIASIADGSYPFHAIVEPHRLTTIKLTEETEDNDTYSWTIQDTADSASSTELTGQGSSITHTFRKAGKVYQITATSESTGKATRLTVHCKYVRREFRSLSREDFEKFMTALEKLYTTDQQTGEALYGEGYVSAATLAAWHLGKDSPHTLYHESPAFFLAHAALASNLEDSLQLIDPTLSLSYWDFVVDAETYGSNWMEESPVFSADWFGPLATNDDSSSTSSAGTSSKAIQGRFKDVKISRGSFAEGFAHNSYGYVQAAFNNNPSSTVTRTSSVCGLSMRKTKLPDCTSYLGAIKQTSMTELDAYTETPFHLSLHTLFGGVWDCSMHMEEYLETLEDSTREKVMPVYTSFFLFAYNLWRMNYYEGYISCPTECDVETPFDECRCEDSEVLEALKELEAGKIEKSSQKLNDLFIKRVTSISSPMAHFYQIMDTSNPLKYTFTGMTEDESDEIKLVLLRSLSTVGMMAPFSTPLGAAVDPIFWPMHLNNERIYHYARLVNKVNPKWDDEWFDGVIGHGFQDPMPPITTLYGNARDSEGSYYTNAELVGMLDPASTSVPYIFENVRTSQCFESS